MNVMTCLANDYLAIGEIRVTVVSIDCKSGKVRLGISRIDPDDDSPVKPGNDPPEIEASEEVFRNEVPNSRKSKVPRHEPTASLPSPA